MAGTIFRGNITSVSSNSRGMEAIIVPTALSATFATMSRCAHGIVVYDQFNTKSCRDEHIVIENSLTN